jgi:hypothetical protein
MNGRSPSAIMAGIGQHQLSSLDESSIRPISKSSGRQAQLNAGIGERDELAAIAEGELKQMDGLSIETTVRLQQFELALDRILGFADSQPDVIAAALVNAHIFVPEMRDQGRVCPSREPIPDGRFSRRCLRSKLASGHGFPADPGSLGETLAPVLGHFSVLWGTLGLAPTERVESFLIMRRPVK